MKNKKEKIQKRINQIKIPRHKLSFNFDKKKAELKENTELINLNIKYYNNILWGA